MVTSWPEKLYLSVVYLILTIVGIVAVFPLLYVVSVSVTPYEELMKYGGFRLIPDTFTFSAYSIFLKDPIIPGAYKVTLFITVVGTAVNLLLTMLMAYPLSKSYLPGKKFFLLAIVFTLLFSGGVVPTYLVVKATGLINSVWAMILPNAIAAFNLLIMKTFFENLPDALDEAARIDGAGETRILLSVVLPISAPIMATIGLFYAVSHWNTFFPAIMYINDATLHPLQVILRGILNRSTNPDVQLEEVLPTETLQMAAVVLTSLPIVVVYPFIQKYFTQGVLLGSVKG
ncbi:putative aldouronate transport system permease protein [Paenibacillus sp. UNCCL117]|uniref:carbohydrate ABC transporter permease n=1 Tax=unclassified Paenibacillus TaxID=185978 RepID=UPI00088AF3F3|nr:MULTISPECIES: carbohydrate ABC transporter permease [unclassified Paenibacillus]SDD03065.1 putative aldouronate transport system permease protein [Paenibacillus sp. cl123]SFW32378.1 putative aldouronate transport system permease protein [Paenibacillus sp. UNCCL117]